MKYLLFSILAILLISSCGDDNATNPQPVTDMVLIPSGTFKMGSTGTTGYYWELPVHTVTITRDFWMSKTEITQKQYDTVMGHNPSYFHGDNLPVELVSWYDAISYCNKRSEMEGLDKCYSGIGTNIVCDWNANGYRLPTEAEWEYACKAGTSNDFYSGSLTSNDCNHKDLFLDKIGWYCGNSDFTTEVVGQKTANSFGLFDMSGNVSEWCWDWYEEYNDTSSNDPTGASIGTKRVLRGGSWEELASACRSSYRDDSGPNSRDNIIGFRIVRNK